MARPTVPEPAWFTGGRRSVAGAAGDARAVVGGAPAVAEAGVLVVHGDRFGGAAAEFGAVFQFHSCSILLASTPLLCAALTIYRNKQ